MKKIISALLMVSASAFAGGKYQRVTINDNKTKESKPNSPTEIESVIANHITDELGSEVRYQGVSKRVLIVTLVEQVAGPDKGKLLAEISYIADPNMGGVVNKDGLMIDAMRVIAALAKDKKIKAKVGEAMLRPHVVIKDGSIEQLAKFQIRLADLKGPNWDGATGIYFENLLKEKGKINITPFFINNGGKFLVLKKEQLNL